jgi:hypothetical protein
MLRNREGFGNLAVRRVPSSKPAFRGYPEDIHEAPQRHYVRKPHRPPGCATVGAKSRKDKKIRADGSFCPDHCQNSFQGLSVKKNSRPHRPPLLFEARPAFPRLSEPVSRSTNAIRQGDGMTSLTGTSSLSLTRLGRLSLPSCAPQTFRRRPSDASAAQHGGLDRTCGYANCVGRHQHPADRPYPWRSCP